MADVDTRRDYRGGGGYSGGGPRGYNNKRKRARDDDDFDSQGYRNQRPRQEMSPGTRIKRGLLDIGEDTLRMPHEQAMNLARLAADNWEDEYVRDAFCTVALKLVSEQPLKIPFVAAVVLFAHTEKPEVAKEVIERAGAQLQENLEQGDWRSAKLSLRFLACLNRVFEQEGIFAILDELFGRAVDLQTASAEDTVGTELVKIILLTIPYLMASTDDTANKQTKAAELLEKTDVVASTPHELEGLVDPFPAFNEDVERPMACTSFIALLQRQLQDEAANAWPLKCIPRIFDPALRPSTRHSDANGDTNGANGADTSKVAFPTIIVPSPVNPGTKKFFPDLYFSVYADQEIESVPRTSDVASCLIRDAVVDTINLLDFNREQTSKFLSMIDSFWSDNCFAPKGTTFDKLRDFQEGRPTWKTEDVAIDAVFSQIFTLPAPEHKLVYYHSLITEICKIAPGAIAPSLGRAIRFLYRGIELMDLELAYRYMDWFAHHLSNFEFRWKWTEWISDIDLPDLHPRKAFINGTLDKEIRLSFAKRIRDTLPKEYHPLIPASKENEIPAFKYNNDQTPFAQEGREVLALLKKKAAEEEVQRVLDTVHEQATNQGLDPLVVSTDIYMTCILHIGSKSLSHVLSTIDRCKDRLLAIDTQNEQARRQVITSVVDFWKDQPGTAVNIVDKLLNYTIVSPIGVIQWALIDHMDRGRSLASAQVYEMISTTMFKVTNRLEQLLQHRNDIKVAFEHRQQYDQVLPRERQSMRELFTAIEDAVAGIASGAQDEMIERFDGGEAEQEFVKQWGARWAKAWRRKAAVEEASVGEGQLAPLEEPPAPPPMEVEVPTMEEDMDQAT